MRDHVRRDPFLAGLQLSLLDGMQGRPPRNVGDRVLLFADQVQVLRTDLLELSSCIADYDIQTFNVGRTDKLMLYIIG